MIMDTVELKKIASDAIDEASEALHVLSQEIWKNPELSFEEEFAHAYLTDFFEKRNFNVERHYPTKTGFRCTAGATDGPNIAVICEYDALPGIGHACGHNLIAEAGAGASIGIQAAIKAAAESGTSLGKLTVLGTPAEEEGGGKVDFIHAGALKGVTCVMMTHPYAKTEIRHKFFARHSFSVRFLGKASHASACPEKGINALDAAHVAYGSLACFRQQMKPFCQIHGIISNGGKIPNVIPEETQMDFQIRAPNFEMLKELKDKAYSCFEGAAKATGCTMEWLSKENTYAEVISNKTLSDLFHSNAKELGIKVDKEISDVPTASTDMGNFSYEVPSIHPLYYFGTDAANHTREFTAFTGVPEAQTYTLQQAKALAMTAIDVYLNKESVVKDMEEEWNSTVKPLRPLLKYFDDRYDN